MSARWPQPLPLMAKIAMRLAHSERHKSESAPHPSTWTTHRSAPAWTLWSRWRSALSRAGLLLARAASGCLMTRPAFTGQTVGVAGLLVICIRKPQMDGQMSHGPRQPRALLLPVSVMVIALIVGLLVRSPWSQQQCAVKFGDGTTAPRRAYEGHGVRHDRGPWRLRGCGI
jgi:hypothetical protein